VSLEEAISFIDLLNRLEKLNILDSAEQWLELRKISNVLSHTYEDEPEEMSIAINDIFDKKEALEKHISNLLPTITWKTSNDESGILGGRLS